MQTRLVHFFQHVLQQDSVTLNVLAGYGDALYFDQENALLIFTLRGLHRFITREKEMEYAVFKKCLYAGTMNTELQALGGRIEIHRSYGKVEQNVYKLVHVLRE